MTQQPHDNTTASHEARVIHGCEVCGNQNLASVLRLGNHPLCDDLVAVGDSRVCREYPIEILFCDTCFTAHHKFQVPKQELFPTTYHYRARFTADVLTGMSGLVDACVDRYGSLEEKTVVDIGGNDGSLLDFFRKKGASTVCIEPTGAAEDARQKGHQVYQEFFGESVAKAVVAKNGPADIITFTNVFAHIENLSEVIAALKLMMSPTTVLVIENHYLGAILDGNQFDTFYHEHPRSYSYRSFQFIARSLGVELLEAQFPARYGGNIRVFMGVPKPGQALIAPDGIEAREAELHHKFDAMQKIADRWMVERRDELLALASKYGKLNAKAFPGRAAILMKLLRLNEDTIATVYEKPGSMKIGHYVPGTRIPIGSDDDLFAIKDKSAPLLNLAWHIPKEIRGYLTANGYDGPVIDILNADEIK
jgi:hypothetical protein